MTQVVIEGEMAERLQKLAADEQIAVEALLGRLLNIRSQIPMLTDAEKQAKAESRRTAAGVFKDDVTDLSTTVRETMQKRFGAKADDERAN